MRAKKKVVIIGGGNGTAKAIVALKPFIGQLELSAVVSMSDSGGSSGKLREQFKTLPPGDIMRAVLAMSKHDYRLLKKIFYTHRFENAGELSGHNLGNLFLTLASRQAGDYVSAVRALEQAVDAVGKVYPATVEPSHLAVELDSGDKVVGEAEIDQPKYDRERRIVKAWLEPEVPVYPEAAQAIREADYILVAGGSLYTSLVAAILPKGLSDEVQNSKAKLIAVVSKFYEAGGETGPTSVNEYIGTLDKYLGRRIDAVLYNGSDLSEEKMKLNLEEGWKEYDLDEQELNGYNFIKADLERDEGFAIDPAKLGKELMHIINE